MPKDKTRNFGSIRSCSNAMSTLDTWAKRQPQGQKRPTLITPSAAIDAPGYKCHATLVDAEALMEILRRKRSEPKRYFMLGCFNQNLIWPLPLSLQAAQTWPMAQSNNVTGIAARLGTVIYWVACMAAVLWAFFVLITTANLPHPDWTISTPIAIVGSLTIWSVGFAVRYLLGR